MKILRRWVSRFVRALATLRAQLVLWFVLLLGLILVGFCLFLDTSLSERLRAQIDAELSVTARQVGDTLDVENDQVRLVDAANGAGANTALALYTADGLYLVSSTSPALTSALRTLSPPVGAELGTIRTVVGPGSQRWRVLASALPERNQVPGVIVIARSEAEIDRAVQQLVLLEALAVPLALLIAIASGLFLAGRALGPIDQITRTAETIGEEDLSRRLGLSPRQDEVGRLAATFDRMLDRLEQAFRRQRQFTADASHELRTPLSVIRNRAEVALDCPRSVGEYRQTLEVVRDEATRLGQLVAELLTLARADAQHEQITREVVALDELVGAVVGQIAPLAEARGVDLGVETVERVRIIGDPTRLAQLLINLVDNAMGSTPDGGMVRVDLRQQGDHAVLAVRDTGIGIAAEHLPHLFDRFYRIDPARSRGGSGLGLAICDWIVRAHGGEIHATSVVGKGSVFQVTLPLGTHEESEQAQVHLVDVSELKRFSR